MLKRFVLLVFLTVLLGFTFFTEGIYAKKKDKKDKDKTEQKDKSKDKAFEELIKDYAKTEGFFTFYRDDKEGKIYMSISPEQLDKPFLCSLTRSSADGSFYDSGADIGEFIFEFRRIGKIIQMLRINVRYRADSSSTLAPAIEKGISNSIFGTAKIESAPDSTTQAVLVNPQGFFLQDVSHVGYYLGTRAKLGYSFDEKNSYFGKIKSFPDNTEIDVHLHFNTKKPTRAATLPSSYSMFHIYHFSIMGIPESDYMPRLADDRVGYFLTMYQDYTDLDPETPYIRYINRWNLKKTNPELDISPPVEPIVFWMENTIPEEYRESVKKGVLYWDKAFRNAGFENAIQVQQMPNDADWEPADTRYNVIQWIVYPGKSYAVGPSHTNPLTGEIYDADVRICADFIRGMYNYVDEFIDPISRDGEDFVEEMSEEDFLYDNYAMKKANEASFSVTLLEARDDLSGKSSLVKKFVNQYVFDLVAHEVGHTLGLRHNFKASTMFDLKQVNDTVLTNMHGMVASTMDYNPANIALPGQPQGNFYNLTPGIYDMWVIEYGYSPIDTSNPIDELPYLKRIADRSGEYGLEYGTDEDAYGNGYPGIDPECNQFDLGTDPIQYYEHRIKLSRELWNNIERKFDIPGNRYTKLRRVFGRGFSSFSSGANIVSKYIGGIRVHRDHIGTPQGKPPFEPVPAAKQRQAMDFLKKHIFAEDAFEFPSRLINKLQPERLPDFKGSTYSMTRLDYPIHNVVMAVQSNALNRLYNYLTLQRLNDLPLHYEKDEEAYTLTEMFTSLRRAIWSPEIVQVSNINSFRRNLQRAHLLKIINLATGKGAFIPEDARTLARVDLKVLKGAINKSLINQKLDTITRGHLEESLARINAAMEAGIQRSGKG